MIMNLGSFCLTIRDKIKSRGQTGAGAAPVWQTDSVTFGRIIIGWRVGT